MPKTLADVFNNDAFSLVSMTERVNKMPFIPGQAGSLGIFEASGISKTIAAIEEKQGVLTLVPVKERGAPSDVRSSEKRKIRAIKVPHLSLESTITADEVQDVRAFGETDEVETVQGVVDERLQSMFTDIDATIEYMRIGAIKGMVMDADGITPLIDLYEAFDVVPQSPQYFDFSQFPETGTGAGGLRTKLNGIIRAIEDELGAAIYNGIHCFCGSAFFDSLIACGETRRAYERWMDGEALRQRTARRTFAYAGIMFEEYRGKVGNISFVEEEDAHFFPVGTPGLFRQHFAPADFVETVNTIGLPRYAKQALDQKWQRYVELHVQSNPLVLCTRPRALVRGTIGSAT